MVNLINFFEISSSYQNAVFIEGPVKRPGIYSYENSMTILDLIQKSNGLNSGDIFRDRVDLIRTLENGKEEFYSFNLDSILQKFKTK